MLGLKFAYATNGREIIEFDYFTGRESLISAYPTPTELWARYRAGSRLSDDIAAARLLTPMNHAVGKGERYYRKSPSTAPWKASSAAAGASCSPWPPAPARPPSPSKSAGSCGTPAGTGPEAPPAKDPLSRRPQHPCGSTQGRHLCVLRRRALQDRRRRGGEEPRDVFRHLPGPGPRRAPAGPVPRVCTRLLRPDRRRRMPPRQRSRRLQLARNPRLFRAGLSVGHDRHSAARRQPRHLSLLRRPDLPVQPAPGHRGRLSRPLPWCTASITEWDAAGWRPSAGDLDRFGRAIPDDEYETRTSNAWWPCAPAPRPLPAT